MIITDLRRSHAQKLGMSLGVFIRPSLRHGNIDIAIAAEQMIFGLSILLRSCYRDEENAMLA